MRELSIREASRIADMSSDRTFSKLKIFSKFFWKPLFSTFHATLFIISRKFFCFVFQSRHPPLRYTTLDSRLPLVMRSRKAGLPFATRARKRELSIREVRIENVSDRKISKSKFFRSFSENHFSPRFMLTCSLLAENIFFCFSKSAPTPRYTILDSRLPSGNAISEGRPPRCNTSSEAGALDTGGTYREWLRPKIF